MAFKHVEAVVIKATNFGEADKIITFFSKEQGKIQGIAKGLRKIRAKYGGKLELFTRVNVIFFQKIEPFAQRGLSASQQLLRITQVDTVEIFPRLQNDFHRIIGASYVAEFINKTCDVFDASHQPLYLLVCQTLRALDSFPQIRDVLPAFEIKLLTHLGYAPVLDRCVNCQRPRTLLTNAPPASEPAVSLPGFHIESGGIVCPNCKPLKSGSLDITSSAITTLQHLLHTDIRDVDGLITTPQIHQEIRLLLAAYIQHHLGIALKTDTFVQKLRSAPPLKSSSAT